MIGEKEIHFSRRFGFWRELKDHVHTVKHKFFASKCDVCSWSKQTWRPHWHTSSKTAVHMTSWAWRKHRTELIRRTPTHCRASNDVFANGLVQETNWCNNLTASCINIGFRRHTKHTTEVVGMRVREDHHCGWQFFNMFVHQFERGACRVFAGEWINNHPTIRSTNERDIRNVVAAHLPHAIGDLE